MRGDQLSRQWGILKQIEVSKNGLTAKLPRLEVHHSEQPIGPGVKLDP